MLRENGFEKVEGWPSVWARGSTLLTIVVFIAYVDDLLMYGAADILDAVIAKIRLKVEMEEPHDVSRYIGCNFSLKTVAVANVDQTIVEYDMRQYLKKAVELFVSETNSELKVVATPYVPDISQAQLDENLLKPGKLATGAPRYLMKLLYCVRLAFPVLALVIQRLASQVVRWTAECDRRLVRIYAFLRSRPDLTLTGCLYSSDLDTCTLEYFPDADLNGDMMSTKSTSGFWIELAGSEGRGCPIDWGAKKQDFTSSHTQEAELGSMSVHLRNNAIPIQSLLSVLLCRPVLLHVREDNSASIQAVLHGYSPSLRHLLRTHRISLGALHDIFHGLPRAEGEGEIKLVKEETLKQKGDFFTKTSDGPTFERCLGLLRVRDTSAG